MELKGYQQKNLDALDRFLSCVDKYKKISEGFNVFWQTNNPPLTPYPGTVIEPYRDNMKGAPHICHKVPTGGGKTFIASAAIKVAMDHINPLYKVVLWLVPSNAILEQTLNNLRNRQHPYRQRIDMDFQSRVVVLDKQQALTGHCFTLATIKENLCILVMSFDAFRTNNKEGRKVYQENGYLQSFAPLVASLDDKDGEVQLMNVLQAIHPLVIVDESHNAVSKLSGQMLNDLHPSLVIDFTATPRENSNIICFTDALELKRNNMVKLPVIVYNQNKKEQVIDSALHLQRQLELKAKQAENGNYIRPIVLFQAESKQQGVEQRETFEKVKQTLLALDIPEEQIKIKTADIDELKGIDLMSRDCPVRYIITVNALKEGWDCPFAYILASLADRSSSVDVEQIVGRVLRLPYAIRNHDDILNLSYVLTASSKFQETLANVVKGLNNAGFSDRDFRAVDSVEAESHTRQEPIVETTSLFQETVEEQDSTEDEEMDLAQISCTEKTLVVYSLDEAHEETVEDEEIDLAQISYSEKTLVEYSSDEAHDETAEVSDSISPILDIATKESQKMDKLIEDKDENMIPVDLTHSVRTATIQSIFSESAKGVKLPMFYIEDQSPQCSLFGEDGCVKLDGIHLLDTFRLSEQPSDISFLSSEASMYKVDIDEASDDHTPRYEKIKDKTRNYIIDYIRKAGSYKDKLELCSSTLVGELGKMAPLSQKDVLKYVSRVLENRTEIDLDDFVVHMYDYMTTIKEKILSLEEEHKEKEFRRLLDTDQIVLKETYSIPNKITLKSPTVGITKMLHTKEESVNGFEAEIINDVANLDNVEWWTRNVEKRGFYINGFINHYPDFIIKTKKGKVILLETKGDHLDASKKINLGNLWASKAGGGYRYYLVYNTRKVEGAFTKMEFINNIKML